ncbi:hypothetical protein NN561_003944 [Cricetulus griseus]
MTVTLQAGRQLLNGGSQKEARDTKRYRRPGLYKTGPHLRGLVPSGYPKGHLPCQVTSQGLPRLQPAGTTVSRVAKRKEFSHDRARSGTIPVRRREERVCGDAAITHRCSCPLDSRVLSPHRPLGAAILLARPMSEAGLPVRHFRLPGDAESLSAGACGGAEVMSFFTCSSGARGGDCVNGCSLLGAESLAHAGGRTRRGGVRAVESVPAE